MSAGTYLAISKSVRFGQTKSGTNQLSICFETQAGEIYWGSLYFSDAALQKTEDSLKAMGWDPNAHGWDLASAVASGALVGKQASIVVKENTYEGKTTLRVEWINDPNGNGGGKQADPQELREFTKILQARMRMAGKLQQQAAASSSDDPDDIPF